MKLQFDSHLPYQQDAINAVVELFRGQAPQKQNFTVSAHNAGSGTMYTLNGIGNRLDIDTETLFANLQTVQTKNALPQSKQLKSGEYQFNIEMETGTGKTYVYLRTILELNKQYGFSKFIIVVPSIAIKEGVYKSLQMTEEHFKSLFANVPYDYFIYDSSKIGQIRNFAVSDAVQIMVINIDAFRKSFDDKSFDVQTKENKANIIHRHIDKLGGTRPIELIQETHPIVIIDEPQSVDSTDKARDALRSLNPLCCLRYSATHVYRHHLIYQLTAIDAFDMGLVKQIEVASLESREYHNKPYVKLLSVDNKKSPITARIELDCRVGDTIKRTKVTVKKGFDLERKTKRDIYRNYFVNEIWCEKGNEYLDFALKPEFIFLGKSMGDVDDIVIKDTQIYKTIEEHLDKELHLRMKHNVKVLSLFFIDRVANYREYDEKGNALKGRYAEIFEKHYNELIAKPKYAMLREHLGEHTAEHVHNGYFAQDKKGTMRDTSGTTADDDTAYNLIMKEKEKLLSFGSKLRFIFSHSALREGWDNPNVFQICTLNETGSEIKKRQEIGRGLRLCVNQHGERLHGSAVNTLTVMANESYEDFVKKLQTEYERESGIRFGVHVKPAQDRHKIETHKNWELAPEFKELWDRVKYKTTYAVNYDSKKLIEVCAQALSKDIGVNAAQLIFTKATTQIRHEGITTIETERASVRMSDYQYQEILPDIITYLQNETNLTRKSCVAILLASGTLDLFKNNPQKYMEETNRILSTNMRTLIVDGIKYTKIGDDEFYAQELFETEELYGYLTKNMVPSKKSPYTHVVYDSQNEEHFARKFEDNNSIKCYVKLPAWFKVPTPLGTYNPDWAVLIEVNNERKLYFVIETKSNLNTLRAEEEAKIACGTKAFEALDGVTYKAVDNFATFMETLPQ